jgi:molecular chaperone HtpG
MTMKQAAVKPRQVARSSEDAAATAIPAAEIVVGKDVLELVSSAMYVDPLTIYREYVQNAADSVDEARRTGLLEKAEVGRVDIELDATARSVRIRDNGTGLPWEDFSRRLTALGASAKRGGVSRGFRGVGRLAGLGYAQQLVFRSRVRGEHSVSELSWDCRALRAALRASERDDGVAELISRLITARRIDASGYPDRFFEVELKGIVRLRSDKLMSPSAVAEYLSQVAPIPFAPDFAFRKDIRAALEPVADMGDLEIRIGGLEGPLYRPHRTGFADDKKQMQFESHEIFRIPDVDGGLAAIGWLVHHAYEGAVPVATGFKGLRLRSGNVQIGGNALLEELFPESRFNAWTVGEIHILDRRIVPNARRDDFEQNAHYNNLLNQLTPIARSVARLCRTSSKRRQLTRDFEVHKQAVEESLSILRQGSLRASGRRNQLVAVEETLGRMTKLVAANELAEVRPKLTSALEKLREKVREVAKAVDTSPLSALPPKRQAMYGHLFELIYDCSANRIAAKALVDRIMEKLAEEIGKLPAGRRPKKRKGHVSRRGGNR